jgi:hypothetical protein
LHSVFNGGEIVDRRNFSEGIFDRADTQPALGTSKANYSMIGLSGKENSVKALK